MAADGPPHRGRPPRRRGWPRLRGALGALSLLLGCYTQRPKSENAPSAAPAPPPPASAIQTAPPAPQESLELKREEPTKGKDAAERTTGSSATGAAVPAPASAPLAPRQKAAGKARSAAPPETVQDRNDRPIVRAEGAAPSDELRQRLERAYRAGTPDCPSARDRRKAVCDLAAQICQLIDRDPNVAAVAEYCADAKERCADAQRRTEERCPP
jgi:hypothetical protein